MVMDFLAGDLAGAFALVLEAVFTGDFLVAIYIVSR